MEKIGRQSTVEVLLKRRLIIRNIPCNLLEKPLRKEVNLSIIWAEVRNRPSEFEICH